VVGHFIAGIAALIWNPGNDKYLLLRRAASKDFGAGSWECVTGRVGQGESFSQAIWREVHEEVGGIAQIEFFVGTTHFYRGAPLPENELLGVVCGCTLADPDAVVISAEHSDYRWLTAVEITHFLPPTHWLQTVVARAEFLRAHLPEPIRAEFRLQGLEIETFKR
jgi:8-oxo-dGTP diphosphatase